jgi:hypothetical protein
LIEITNELKSQQLWNHNLKTTLGNIYDRY